MSPKQPKPNAEPAGEGVARERTLKPKGAAPGAVVTTRHGAETIQRQGRGFSLGELAAAQLPASVAMRWGVQVDLRRRSTSEENAEALRAWAAGAKKVRKEGEVKRVEEELVKVGKEVKKEAVKAEKEVKEEVEKVKKEVRRKEPTKKRPSKKKASPKSK